MKLGTYEQYIATSRYARYLPEKKRRETWEETVGRYLRFMSAHTDMDLEFLYNPIHDMAVLPSMRAVMVSGVALERDHVASYNCAYTSVDNIRVFDEALYIMLCGIGLGYSVERQYVTKLPEVAEDFHDTDTTIVVRDSKLGWAKALRELVHLLYAGQIPKIDTSGVRPAGAPLKTFGGRASGPEPFERMCRHFIRIFKASAGRRLTSIEVHDLLCHEGEAVFVGGVRRTALISLSNLSDERMSHAKMGNWYIENPQRSLANNSVCFTEQPDMGAFMREWLSLYESRSGERGIFNRQASTNMLPERRDPNYDFGTNPCSEIVLRGTPSGGQFCNLTEVVARYNDDFHSLMEKVEWATILGTIQSSLTDFRYLRKGWKTNCEEERLLGVSITGIYDSPWLLRCDNEELELLREVAVITNQEWAKKLKINPSTAVTCVKPSGTVSQLASCSSGIHPSWNRWYTRRVRNDKKDPLAQVMIDAGIPYEEDKVNTEAWVFSFPIKAEGKTRKDVTPLQQLEVWKKFALHWCEHKPSMTCYVGENDWFSVGAWVWENFNIVNGISFLPASDEDHIYEQAPYQDLTKPQYTKMKKAMPEEINFQFEEDHDSTTASQEMACVAGVCEI